MRTYVRTGRHTGFSVGPLGMVLLAFGYLVYLVVVAVVLVAVVLVTLLLMALGVRRKRAGR